MSDLTNKLAMIQQKLKAPKGQVNTFGYLQISKLRGHFRGGQAAS
jgi:hypothetical protein